jgi:hypothetical protein
MPSSRSFRIALCLATAGVIFPSLGNSKPQDSQQPPTDSVADAARRAREQKKNGSPASKVITDDDIDNKHIQPGAEGLNVGAPARLDSEPPSPAAVSAVVASDAAAAAAAGDATPKDGESPQVAQLKEELAQLQKEYDLMQRELALDQDAYYSKTDYASDKAGQSKINAEKQQTTAKQQELDDLKTRLAAALDLAGRKESGSADRSSQPQ